MKTAIIIHGMPDKENYFDSISDSQSNCHWLPWLQQQLLVKDIFTQTPEMPAPYLPNYEAWKKEFERFDINENTILVGHSCGGGFLIRYLSENNIKVNKVALIAPWIALDLENEYSKLTGDFFKFNIDENLTKKTNGISMFISSDDEKDILENVEFLKEKLKGISLKEFTNKGHFTLESMGTREFPELLEFLIS